MRGPALMAALLLPISIAILFTCHDASADSDWAIEDHVTLQGQDLVLDMNVSVLDGGWLEVLGSTLRFDCSRPFEHTLTVNPGGQLTVGPSSTGAGSLVGSLNATCPTRIEVHWPRSVVIQELSMRDCGSGIVPALLIDNAIGVVVRNCEFIDCEVALSLRSCTDVEVVGNRVTGARVRAMELGSVVDCAVQFNRIRGCNVGIEVQYSTGILIQGNVLSDVAMVGLSLVLVDDVIVKTNSYALLSGRAIEVRSSKLLSVEEERLAGPPSRPDVVSGILVQDSSLVRVQDCAMTWLREAVTISAFFGDRAESNLLSRIDISDCGMAFNISSVANRISGCTIERCDVGILIGPIYDEASNDNIISGCEVDDCGVGISLRGSRSTTIESSTLRGCPLGISGQDALGTLVLNSTLLGCTGTAMAMARGELFAWNCTVEGCPLAMSLRTGGKAVVRQSSIDQVELCADLEDGSTLELHNTTHVRAYEIDGRSSLTIWWDVELLVGFESGDRSEGPGLLTIRNALGGIEASVHIPALPWGLSTELRESSRTGGASTMFTPHTFIASAPVRTGSAEAVIDRFSRVVISIDDVPPRVHVQSPASESSRDRRLTLIGHCEDNTSQDVAIEIRLDGVLLYTGENRWEMDVDVLDGIHPLEYTVTDGSGNVGGKRQRILVDSTPPELTMLSPQTNPFLVADDHILISGRVVNGSGASLDGIVQALEDGVFRSILELPEDGGYTCAIMAWDDMGNNISLVVTISRDLTAPVIELDEYPNLTRAAQLVIGGRTDLDVERVRMNGREVPLLPGSIFTLILDLAEGANVFNVTAFDAAENHGEATVSVRLDTQAAFDVVWPPDGTVVQTSEVDVVVLGEADAQYRIGPMAWADADSAGYCTMRITLYESENSISVTMRDQAGNLGERSFRVIYSPRVILRETDSTEWALLIVVSTVLGLLALFVLHRKYGSVRD